MALVLMKRELAKYISGLPGFTTFIPISIILKAALFRFSKTQTLLFPEVLLVLLPARLKTQASLFYKYAKTIFLFLVLFHRAEKVVFWKFIITLRIFLS